MIPGFEKDSTKDLARDRDSGSESDRDRDDVDDDESDSEDDSENERDEGGDGDQRMRGDRQGDERNREGERDRNERHAGEVSTNALAYLILKFIYCLNFVCALVVSQLSLLYLLKLENRKLYTLLHLFNVYLMTSNHSRSQCPLRRHACRGPS